MKTDSYHDFILNQLTVAQQQLSNYQQTHDPETLHQLRVAIKKLKAVCFFLNHFLHQKITIAALIELFDEAGAIRELQLTIELIQSNAPSYDHAIRILKKDVNALDDGFSRRFLSHNQLINNFKKHFSLPDEIAGKKRVLQFFLHLLEKAESKLHHERSLLHDFRIAIKRLLYIYGAMPNEIKKEIPLDKELIIEQQQKLGEWHDSFAALAYLSKRTDLPEMPALIALLRDVEIRQFHSLSQVFNISMIGKEKLVLTK